ncbi:hypothetical protein O181_106298 [Austropuccinia psidii MF-1]|uniref:Uncharacterized protein n=1 Tax=Austropuccinia psidii MF-1 TaxID=1389203 RepID=A0A9Q3PLU8_9BASI|nr:hypothetical protein [Austropuccinia psidii MF-1]
MSSEELEHSLRRRCIELCSTEEYLNSLEDIFTTTTIGRKWKNLDIKSSNKPFIKKDKPKPPFKPNKTNEKGRCNNYGGIENLANNSFKKTTINEIVKTGDHNNKEEDSDS